jgi:hypothetical protein
MTDEEFQALKVKFDYGPITTYETHMLLRYAEAQAARVKALQASVNEGDEIVDSQQEKIRDYADTILKLTNIASEANVMRDEAMKLVVKTVGDNVVLEKMKQELLDRCNKQAKRLSDIGRGIGIQKDDFKQKCLAYLTDVAKLYDESDNDSIAGAIRCCRHDIDHEFFADRGECPVCTEQTKP